jgi:hypothetical protein
MLQALLADLRDRPSRTGALIITLYGDALASRGGSVWLGTLLEVFRAMGVGDGVVRTAVSRLATEGWLSRSRAGRNSFYRLDQAGRRESEARYAGVGRGVPAGAGGAGGARRVCRGWVWRGVARCHARRRRFRPAIPQLGLL